MRKNKYPERETGFIHDTRSGKLEVIKYVNAYSVFVRFKGCENIIKVNASNIRKSSVFNPMFPSVFNRGYHGEGNHSVFIGNNRHTLSYRRWFKVLSNCFSDCSKWKGEYSVCKRWLNFQNFCDDLPKLENYYEFVANPSNYRLMKANESVEYNINTCFFESRTKKVSRYNRG